MTNISKDCQIAFDYVLIKLKDSLCTDDGIIITVHENEKYKQTEGVVVSVGEDVLSDIMEGDTVFFKKHLPIPYGEHYLLYEKNILLRKRE